jgi:hypothetical protein
MQGLISDYTISTVSMMIIQLIGYGMDRRVWLTVT